MLNDGLMVSTKRIIATPFNALPNRSTVLSEKEEDTPDVKMLINPTTLPD
jgi:hypothetical protein